MTPILSPIRVCKALTLIVVKYTNLYINILLTVWEKIFIRCKINNLNVIKMRVTIRDDDINFFTQPSLIENIYGGCFDRRIEICLGVTPLQKRNAGNLRTDIPKNISQTKYFNILLNKKLCRSLKRIALKGNEICMHGISHSENEPLLFTNDNMDEQFEQGMRIIEKACSVKAKTYIPPYARLYREEVDFLLRKKMNVSYGFHFHYKSLFLPFKQLYLRNVILHNDCKTFLSDEYLFGYVLGKRKNPKTCYEYAKRRFNLFYRLNKPFIIVNHYWDFSDNCVMISYWNKFIKYIVEKPNVEFTTFKDFA